MVSTPVMVSRSGDSSSTESDYTIFVWRQKSVVQGRDTWPVLHVRDPEEPLPSRPSYQNPSFYMFMPKPLPPTPSRAGSGGDGHSTKSTRSKKTAKTEPQDTVPKFKKEFEKFHNENGVRTIMGDIGPVQNGKHYSALSSRDVRLMSNFISSNAVEEWLPSCVHVQEVCSQTRFHSNGCSSWTLWIWRTSQVRVVRSSDLVS